MGIHNCYNGTRELSDHEKFVERRDAAKHAARQEKKRVNEIMSHPSVQSGRLYKLGCFLALETDMCADECLATLDRAHPGNDTAHAGGSQAAERAAAQHAADHEANRRRIQAENDAGYEAEVTRRGGRVQDNFSERDKQKSEDFLNIARRARQDENEDDSSNLKAMGFGGGAQIERGSYEAGAAAASRLLGKGSPRAGNTGYAREALRPATSAPSIDASYSAGAESARRLLGDTSAIRAEADNELRQRFADQQRARAQN
jgi:hypothetical protein